MYYNKIRHILDQPSAIGQAYVDRVTLYDVSKLSIAFTKPRHPTWKRSSRLSTLLLNFFRIDKTNFRLPLIRSSLANGSTSCIFFNNYKFCALVNGFNDDVLIPDISTLYFDINKTPFITIL